MIKNIFLWSLLATIPIFSSENFIDEERKNCLDGGGMACLFIAASYIQEKDLSKGIIYLEKACEYGAYVGCYNLGNIYARGQGLEQDLDKAKELFKRACDKGVDNACYNYNILKEK